MTKNEAVARALFEKKSKLQEKTAVRENEIFKLLNTDSEYESCCALLSKLGSSLSTETAKKRDGIIKEMNAVSSRRDEILAANGLKDIDYDCDFCKDTGYVGGALCDCVKQAAKRIMIAEISEKTPLDECRFDNFDLSFYKSAEAIKRMTGIFTLCKDYAENFDPKSSPNLLFMGNTGLGKTHLSLSVVGEVINKGYSVLYSPAYNLFSKMEREHFDSHINDTYNLAVECDLLVIDDLGGEFVSGYIQTLVYNILNTRLLAKRPTLINTNLSMEEINNRYTPRVASRLIGEYTAKIFLGNDIRQLKKLQ